MEPKSRSRIIILALSTALLAGTASAAEVYRWVDENGEVHYSETLPPDFEDQGHDVLDQQGIVRGEDRKLTPPPPPKVPDKEAPKELPRDSSGLKRPTALYSEAEMQRRMDSFLMLRYDSQQEITDAMNVEIKQLDYDRRLLNTTRESMKKSYRGQIKQAAELQRAGTQVDSKVSREIAALRASLKENKVSMDNLELRENEIRTEFGKQLDRYRYLEEEWAKESAGS